MSEFLEIAAPWSVPIVALILLAIIIAQRPWRMWRWIASWDSAAPLWLLFALSIVGFLAGRLSLRHLDALIATGPTTPASARWADKLDYFIGFLWRGFTGSNEAVDHMQGLLLFGSVGLAAALLLYRLRYSAFTMQIDQINDATPRRVIIMGLSELPAGADDAIKAASQMDLGTASAANLGRLPWQQNLRVLDHHFTPPRPEPGWVVRRLIGLKLRREPGRCHVIVLPSPESRKHAQQFVEMVKACIARTAERTRAIRKKDFRDR